jgi:hypothetical protein
MERIGKRIFQVILIGGTINVTHIWVSCVVMSLQIVVLSFDINTSLEQISNISTYYAFNITPSHTTE